MGEIKGILYGKVTPVFRKNYNKKLENWLCFSLIMKTRSLDFYCENNQLNPWLIALSVEVKRKNPKAFTLTPGRILWRKIKHKLIFYFQENQTGKKG